MAAVFRSLGKQDNLVVPTLTGDDDSILAAITGACESHNQRNSFYRKIRRCASAAEVSLRIRAQQHHDARRKGRALP
jgi:hypothetical protein